MRTLLTVGVVVIVLAALVWWLFPWSKDYVVQTRDDIDQGFAAKVRDDRIITKAEEEFNNVVGYLREQYLKVVDAKRELANQQSNRGAQAKKLAAEEAAITKASAWLDSYGPDDKVVINGQEYTFATVAADARTRVENCQSLKSTIGALDESCEIIHNSIAEGETKIREALADVQAKRDAMQAKRVQLAALRAVEAAESIASGMRFDGTDVDEISTHYNDELDRRISQVQGRREFSRLNTTASGVVPWGSEGAKQSDLDAVRAYVQENLAPAPVTESPDSVKIDLNQLEASPAQ